MNQQSFIKIWLVVVLALLVGTTIVFCGWARSESLSVRQNSIRNATPAVVAGYNNAAGKETIVLEHNPVESLGCSGNW